MKGLGWGLAIGLALWIAGGLQQAIAPRLALAGGTPDFLLILLAAGSLTLSRSKAALLGFICGLIHGSLAGANLTHYIISRTAGGFLAAWAQNTRIQPSPISAFLTAAFLTAVSQILLMFLAAPPNLGAYLGATIVAAAYNGVLVLPVYFLAKKLLGPPRA